VVTEEEGNPLKVFRESQNWSQNDLGMVLGVSSPRISLIESGGSKKIPEEWLRTLVRVKKMDEPESIALQESYLQWRERKLRSLV